MRALVNGIIVGCLLLILAGSAGAQTKNVALDDLLGDWLNRDYVEALKKTRSPLESLKMRYSAMTFTKKARWYEWMVVVNFHEAGRFNNIDGLHHSGTADNYTLEFNKNQYGRTIPENDRIVYPDGSLDALAWLSIIDGKEQRIQFVRVKPTMEAYVNQVVLAGEYTDTTGRKIVFTDNCKAIWPDETFTYVLGLDHVLTKCDYLYITEPGAKKYLAYAFEWKDSKLLIYNVVRPTEGFEAMYPAREPVYVLTPAKK